jgi:large subunit ribosomal protein L25
MLEGIIRDSIGKKSTKALRRDGYLIGNVYAKGVENLSVAFKKNEFIKAVKSKTTLAFDIKVGDKTINVLIQEYQKDPINSNLLHVDLLATIPGQEANYKIPVKTVGIPKGLKNKGILVFHKRRLKVRTTPEKLPSSIELNVEELEVGDSILIRDIDLGDGVKTFIEGRVPVVGVIKAK